MGLSGWVPIQARRILQRVRGTPDVDTEVQDITQASAIAAQARHYLLLLLDAWPATPGRAFAPVKAGMQGD
jgi:hypothetical protein